MMRAFVVCPEHVNTGWIPEERPLSESVAAGWSGVLSFPRDVILNDDLSLSFPPTEEVTLLRSPSESCYGNLPQVGIDYPGGDYTNYNLTGQSDPMNACRDLCCQDSECVLWSFVMSQPATDWNCDQGDVCCWVKSSIYPMNPNPIVTVRD